MYFVKARKHIEEQDATDLDRIIHDRCQRAESTRLFLEALPQPQRQSSEAQIRISTTQQSQISDTEPGLQPKTTPNHQIGRQSLSSMDGFRPEELPDGACYRPKNGRPMSPGTGPSPSDMEVVVDATAIQQSQSKGELTEFVRSAQYVGTFSVSGSDKKAREKQMEIQLLQMKDAKDVTPVQLIISHEGVKVMNQQTGSRIMEHSLKRIWYATCDPESCQFSFLAREPKTSAEVQYCHAFLTTTAQEAEELISIMGDAFKANGPGTQAPPVPGPESQSAPQPESKKQPTFHEIIEQQVQQQQAKFREIEKEAKVALQQRLTEIATPTPFSGVAMHRMGQRRLSSDEAEMINQKNRMWAKQLVTQQYSHPSTTRMDNNWNNNRRSEIPLRQSTPQSSPSKRNSVPASVGETSSFGPISAPSVPSSPAHALSALAIKESVQSSSKFKGSPVTALKNEIDRRLTMEDTSSDPIVTKPSKQSTSHAKDKIPPKPSMANRPLPSPPGGSGQESRLKSKGGRNAGARERHSFDDNSLPQGSPDKVKMRNSPRRGNPRPMSEIAVGSNLYQQQRHSLLHNFASSFNNTAELEAAGYDTPFMYGPQQQQQQHPGSQPALGSKSAAAATSSTSNFLADKPPNPARERGGGDAGKKDNRERSRGRERDSGGGGGGRRVKEEPLPPPQQLSPQDDLYETVHDSSSQSPSSPQPQLAPQEALRYENGSPFYAGDGSNGGVYGFDSLMSLDRSHIHDVTLRNAPWYQAGLAREIALDILQQEEVGSFIVRDSSTHPGCYALSVRVPKFENSSGISHYLILRTHRGVKLKGLDKEWSTLNALVTHHTVMREMLPCTLRLPKTSANNNNNGGGGSSVGGNNAASQAGKEETTSAVTGVKGGGDKTPAKHHHISSSSSGVLSSRPSPKK